MLPLQKVIAPTLHGNPGLVGFSVGDHVTVMETDYSDQTALVNRTRDRKMQWIDIAGLEAI